MQQLLPARFGPLDLLEDPTAPLLLEQQQHHLTWSSRAQAVLQGRAGHAAFQQAASAALSAAQLVRTAPYAPLQIAQWGCAVYAVYAVYAVTVGMRSVCRVCSDSSTPCHPASASQRAWTENNGSQRRLYSATRCYCTSRKVCMSTYILNLKLVAPAAVAAVLLTLYALPVWSGHHQPAGSDSSRRVYRECSTQPWITSVADSHSSSHHTGTA